ncbi:MAG: hypothetical protein A2252_10710 [Elusimicrobia bacterium RIFOXYA2_FULL_39_19]|nr:MAG: hypothetical protein A2252_10710 [Elusimicrobia bacterium RIFOXYA2_FULL_39_19]
MINSEKLNNTVPDNAILLKLKSIVKSFWYAGNNVECLCCGWKGRKFLELNGRENVQCPRCFSLERQRLTWSYLQKKTDILTNKHAVLHFAAIGPEKIIGDRLKKIKNLSYLSVDISNKQAMEKMDITNIKYPDGFFDVIICVHVLEHVADDKLALKELYRVLQPGGWAIIMAPLDKTLIQTIQDISLTDPLEQKRKFGLEGHIRLYGIDYKNILELSGFKVKIENYAAEFTPEQVKKYSLDISDDIYICTKHQSKG